MMDGLRTRLVMSMSMLLFVEGMVAMSAGVKPVRLVPPPEMEGWKAESAEGLVVTPNTIFDYMNGAGELYMAFQFEKLHVWIYERDGETSITVEAYKLRTHEEAYGVLSQDLDGEEIKIGQGSVYGAGLLMFRQARWYFRILAEYETPEVRRAVLRLGRAFAGQIPSEGGPPKILKRLPAKGQVPRTVRYFHKQICLNAFYFFAIENILQLSDKTAVVMADYKLDKNTAKMMLIRYPSAAAAAKAHAQFRKVYLKGLDVSTGPIGMAQLEDKEYVGLRLDKRFLVLAFKSRSRDLCERLLEAANLKTGGNKR